MHNFFSIVGKTLCLAALPAFHLTVGKILERWRLPSFNMNLPCELLLFAIRMADFDGTLNYVSV